MCKLIRDTFNSNHRKFQDAVEKYEPASYQTLVDVIAKHGLSPVVSGAICTSFGTNLQKTLLFILPEPYRPASKFWHVRIAWDERNDIDALAFIKNNKDKAQRIASIMALANRIVDAIEPLSGDKVLG